MTNEQLKNLFMHHAPKGDQVHRYESIRAAGLKFAQEIIVQTPGSPEQTLALRAVHAAVMHANSAIAVNE